jgi:hypothetical protein
LRNSLRAARWAMGDWGLYPAGGVNLTAPFPPESVVRGHRGLREVLECDRVKSSTTYYTDPRITFIPFSDLSRCEAALVWRTADHSPRLNSFTHTATDLLVDNKLGERVLASDHQDPTAVAQYDRADGELGRADGQPTHDDVNVASAEPVELVPFEAGVHEDGVAAGVACLELIDDLCHPRAEQHPQVAPDPDGPGDAGGCCARFGECIVQLALSGLELGEQLLAQRSETDVPAGAIKEPAAELGLEPADQLAGIGRGDI